MPIKEPPPLRLTAEEPDDDNNRRNNDDDELLTTEQLAQLWKVNPKTIQRKVREGELEAIDMFGEYRFKRTWLRKYLKKRKIKYKQAEDAQEEGGGG